MPAPHPPGFRRRAIDLARQPGASVARVTKDVGISESGLRGWMSQDDIDSGRREGLSTSERAQLVRPRRENRRQPSATPTGRPSLIVHNENDAPRSFAVAVGDLSFEYTLPGGAVATFTWPPAAVRGARPLP